MGNLQEQPWLQPEFSKTAKEFIHQQIQELTSIKQTIESLWDARAIKYWDLIWDEDKKCWTFDIYPHEPFDIIEYYNHI